MTPMNIIVKFVRKNEIPSNGSTVQSAAFLLIMTVFLGKIQMSSNTCTGHQFGGATQNLTFTHTQCTFIEEIKTNDNVKSNLSMCPI